MVWWPCNPQDINTMHFNWKLFPDHLFWSFNEFSVVDNNIIWYSWGFLRTTVLHYLDISTMHGMETGKPESFSFSHPQLCIVWTVGWGRRRTIYLAGLTSSVTNVAQSLKCSNLMASEMFRQHLLSHLKWAEFFQWKSDEEEFTWRIIKED